MGAELEKRFGAEVKLVPGDRGAFEVKIDGQKVFSKLEVGRFPEDEEIFAHFT